MESTPGDPGRAAMLDGNAAAGVLSEIFAVEMTASMSECANCGNKGELATLLAFMQAPGLVLRCPVCEQVILRLVQTPTASYLDVRGAAYIALRRPAG